MKTTIIVTTLPGVLSSVHIEASGKSIFKELLRGFKSKVPSRYRNYSEVRRSWSVTVDGFAALDAWLADVQLKHPRFEVVRAEVAPPRAESADPLDVLLTKSRRLLEQIRETDKEE